MQPRWLSIPWDAREEIAFLGHLEVKLLRQLDPRIGEVVILRHAVCHIQPMRVTSINKREGETFLTLYSVEW
jgi:hypothetical protein